VKENDEPAVTVIVSVPVPEAPPTLHLWRGEYLIFQVKTTTQRNFGSKSQAHSRDVYIG
jgi:hypothetical protein